MVIDSHVHLLDPRLRERAEEIVKKLKDDGVEAVVEISADVVEARECVDFACKHENVYCTIGVHPIFADSFDDRFEEWAYAQKGNPKIVAVGECGLDYYHMNVPVEIQKAVFIAQIKLADRMGLALVVHSRDAFDDVFDILMEHRGFLNNGIILHCFSGGAAEVERFKVFDCYFAFGGAITYKNSAQSAEAIAAVPRDRLMIETDCPYLSPVPLRGSINEPRNVKIVAEHVAGILGITFDEVARKTSENTKRVYKIRQ
jgi:TatD DNase family protein